MEFKSDPVYPSESPAFSVLGSVSQRTPNDGKAGFLMVWVKLDDHFDQNTKVASVGPLGIALWTVGLAYCNRNLTDGFIPWTIARSLLSWEYLEPPNEDGRRRVQTVGVTCGMAGDDVDSARIIDLLIHAGLWEVDDDRGGYIIHDYDDYQPSKEQVESERRNSAERTAKSRANSRGSNAASNTVTNSVSTPAPVPVPVPVPVNPIQNQIAAAAAREDEFSSNGEPSETDEAIARLIREWERATGTTVTAMLGDELASSLGELPEDWIADAIRETGLSGGRSWRYTKTILDRWKLQGREPSPEPIDATDKFRNSRVLAGIEKWRSEAAK